MLIKIVSIALFCNLLLLSPFNSVSQNNSAPLTFSLKEAQDYAVENSYKSKVAELDISSTDAQRKQFYAIGLPQVNGTITYQNYIEMPTQLMPDFLTPAVSMILKQYGLIQTIPEIQTGETIPVQFGAKNNLTASATLSQLIFNGSFIFGLEGAKKLLEQSKIGKTKSDIDIKVSIAQTYYMVLIYKESIEIVDSILKTNTKTYNDTKAAYANGFIDKTDLDQTELMLEASKSSRDNIITSMILYSNLLKYQMGLDVNSEIILSSNLEDLLTSAFGSSLIDKPFDYNNHIDYIYLKTFDDLNNVKLKVDKSKYYPSLSCFLTTQENAQRTTINFFNGEEWYNTSVFGLGMSIPIWSSGDRGYQIKIDKINIDKIKVQLNSTSQGLQMQVINAKESLKNSTYQYKIAFKSTELSKNIYQKNIIKFEEGVATSNELNTSYNQYMENLKNYYNSILGVLNANITLNKALNIFN